MLETHTNTISYADDTLTFATAPTQNGAISLAEAQFNDLSRWYNANGLSLNITKTKYLLLSNRKADDNLFLHLQGTILKPEKSITILGIQIDSKLSFESHIEGIVKRANSITYVLRKIRHLLNYEESRLIYTSIIRPKLEYSSSLFINLSKSLILKIEQSQNRALRVICRAHKLGFSATDSRLLLNLHTLLSRRVFFFRNLLCKTLSGTSSRHLLNILKSLTIIRELFARTADMYCPQPIQTGGNEDSLSSLSIC